MKRIVSAILALMMLLPGLSAFAADHTASGTCGIHVGWTLDEDGVLTVSGEGFMIDSGKFSEYAAPWNEYADDIREVVISEGVKNVGAYVFRDLQRLNKVTLAKSVQRIDSGAFLGCTGLRDITLCEGLQSIATGAFRDCSSLKEVVIPASVDSIAEEAFASCSSLEQILVDASNPVYCIESRALIARDHSLLLAYPCASAVENDYCVPKVVRIGGFAFERAGLRHIKLPESVVYLGNYAFQGCTSLETVSFPSSLKEIGNSCFESSGLESLILTGDGVKIGEFAFSGCKNLRLIRLPQYVGAIEEQAFNRSAFYNEPANWADGCLYIGTALVEAQTDLTGTCVVRPGTTLIASYAFLCSEVSEIQIPDSVVSIGCRAFRDCRNLHSLALPRHAMKIAREAIPLELLEEQGGIYYLDKHLIITSEKSASVAIRPGTVDIAGYGLAFSEAERISLPETVEIISECAFANCEQLQSINIPDSVVSIGAYAFADCISLQSLRLPPQLEEIETQICRGCTALHAVSIPASVSVIQKKAFSDSSALEDVMYGGTDEQWQAIVVRSGNDPLLLAPRQHRSCQNPSWTVSTAAPTAEAGGYTMHRCSCGYSYITDEQPATGGAAAEEHTQSPAKMPYADVSSGAYYYDAVAWAVEQGITAGTSKTSFSPNDTCTRGQVVTFLWRAAGEPAPQSAKNPFKDVSERAYYYNAVLWAVEQGITAGTSKTSFSPNETCTRGQVVTFLWRAAGEPAPQSAKNPFKDVSGRAYYNDAVLWAVEQGITSGTSKDTFSPGDSCTRGQIVTFLYRAKA